MIQMPSGAIYENEIKRENCIAITDSPDSDEIKMIFEDCTYADKIIYARGTKAIKEYFRKDYIK